MLSEEKSEKKRKEKEEKEGTSSAASTADRRERLATMGKEVTQQRRICAQKRQGGEGKEGRKIRTQFLMRRQLQNHEKKEYSRKPVSAYNRRKKKEKNGGKKETPTALVETCATTKGRKRWPIAETEKREKRKREKNTF